MLHKVQNAHREILDGLPELKALLPSSVRNKKMLLGMAERGEQRPNKKTPLGEAISRYTRKKSPVYDPAFTKQIRKLAPHWLVSKTERSDHKKKLLLEMARKGGPKPKRNTPLGTALRHYARKSSGAYDPQFRREIRELRPEWFLPNTETADRNKKLLLQMAREGKPRPGRENPLGISFSSYMTKSHNSHDPAFTQKIRKLAPHWFRKCSTS